MRFIWLQCLKDSVRVELVWDESTGYLMKCDAIVFSNRKPDGMPYDIRHQDIGARVLRRRGHAFEIQQRMMSMDQSARGTLSTGDIEWTPPELWFQVG